MQRDKVGMGSLGARRAKRSPSLLQSRFLVMPLLKGKRDLLKGKRDLLKGKRDLLIYRGSLSCPSDDRHLERACADFRRRRRVVEKCSALRQNVCRLNH